MFAKNPNQMLALRHQKMDTNQKIKMPGPEFSCRSKNAASYVQALFQKKNRIKTKRTERVRSFVRSTTNVVACLLACLPLPPHPTQETPPAPPPTLAHCPDTHSLLLLLSADDD